MTSLLGCGEPPAHCANWWYYWRDGEVVDGMRNTKYLWYDPPKLMGVASPEKSTSIVGLSDLVLATLPRSSEVTVQNKYNPALTYKIVAKVTGGIDSAAQVITHEYKHIDIYLQWGALIRQTGVIKGLQNSDSDGIPDDVELDYTAGGIGAQYEFDIMDPDTYNLCGVREEWNPYAIYGDNELLARMESLRNPRTRHPERDWSKYGAQWGKREPTL